MDDLTYGGEAMANPVPIGFSVRMLWWCERITAQACSRRRGLEAELSMYAPCFYTVVMLGQMRKTSEYWEASGAISQDIDWLGFLSGGGKLMRSYTAFSAFGLT